MGPVLHLIGVILANTAGLAGLILAIVQIFSTRDSRGRAQKEADVLSKLDPESEAAKLLRQIIAQRIARWHRQTFKPERAPKPKPGTKPKPDRRDHLVEGLEETMVPRAGPTPRWVWIVVGIVSLGLLTFGIIGALNSPGDARQLCLVHILVSCS